MEAEVANVCKEMEIAMKRNRSIFSITNYMSEIVVYSDGKTEMTFPLTNIVKLRELDKKFDYEDFLRFIANLRIEAYDEGDVYTKIGIFKYDKKNKKWKMDRIEIPLNENEKEKVKAEIINICKEIEMAMRKHKSIFSITNYIADRVIYSDGSLDISFPLTNIDKLKELDKQFDYEYFFKWLTNEEIYVLDNGYIVYTDLGTFKYNKEKNKWEIAEFSFSAEESTEE
ncbi:hypothetical protein [Thermospira aquatica]|uniref:Uncharacterized protein n=1 Tax=Thermospira aquatica TaxID=2828656 RepID=A0AAX3BGK1_9SPIR|nr:hypothetical protein [Thermospira aquatica]URA10576.1 hypothetical protein KDW03_01885 [Thermospira aquatica]